MKDGFFQSKRHPLNYLSHYYLPIFITHIEKNANNIYFSHLI